MYATNLSIALIFGFLISSCYCDDMPSSSTVKIPQKNVLARSSDSIHQCLLNNIPEELNDSNIQQFCTYVTACDIGCISNDSVENGTLQTSVKIKGNDMYRHTSKDDVHNFVDTLLVIEKTICVLGGIALLLATPATGGLAVPPAVDLAAHCTLVLGGAELADALMKYFKW
ncbi:hypothetical protein ACI65C_001515 [Semiaphis heraclei]